MHPKEQATIDEIINFWFEETIVKQKLTKNEVFDALIKNWFEPVFWQIMQGETESWRSTPEGKLAEVVVLDQFARNMFRGDKQSFAGDELALALAKEAIETGADMTLPEDRRQAFYMPFMHSESKAVHEEAAPLFTERASESVKEYEQKHKAIIDQFGRYPHRNEILGRESTPDELIFLEEHSGF